MAKTSILLFFVVAVFYYTEAGPVASTENEFEALENDPDLKQKFYDFFGNVVNPIRSMPMFEELRDDQFFVDNFRKFFGDLINSDVANKDQGAAFVTQGFRSVGGSGTHQAVAWTSETQPGGKTKVVMVKDDNGSITNKEITLN